MKKIALFADVQNLYYTVRQAHGCHFNYAALWAELSARGEIVEAYAYAIDRGDASTTSSTRGAASSTSMAMPTSQSPLAEPSLRWI